MFILVRYSETPDRNEDLPYEKKFEELGAIFGWMERYNEARFDVSDEKKLTDLLSLCLANEAIDKFTLVK